jgi:hypothetical protein
MFLARQLAPDACHHLTGESLERLESCALIVPL